MFDSPLANVTTTQLTLAFDSDARHDREKCKSPLKYQPTPWTACN